MLVRLHSLLGRRVAARDGVVGHAADFLLDDQTWSIRFLVAIVGPWLRRRTVYLPTFLLGSETGGVRPLYVDLTAEEILGSFCASEAPDIAGNFRLTFHHNAMHSRLWRPERSSSFSAPSSIDIRKLAESQADGASLRSLRMVLAYRATGIDGREVADIADFGIDTVNWAVRDIVLQRGIGPFSSRALVSSACVEGLSAATSSLQFDGTRDSLRWLKEHPAQ